MKGQEIVVLYPSVQFIVGGEVEATLEQYRCYVNTIKELRGVVESHTKKFVSTIITSTRKVYNYKGSETELSFSSVEVTVEDERKLYMGPVTMEASHPLATWQLPTAVADRMPHAAGNLCADAIETLGVQIMFLEYGITVECLLQRSNRGWGWDLMLSEVMVTYEQGKEVKIKYGSYLHNALWRLARGLDSFTPAPEDLQTIVTLERLDLIGKAKLVPNGVYVLEELEKINPSEVSSLVTPFAGVLLSTQTELTPMGHFAVDRGFIERKDDRYTTPQVPDLLTNGKDWLTANCLAIVNSSSCSETRKLSLVEYLPLKWLPSFLTHASAKIREAARERANRLEGGV